MVTDQQYKELDALLKRAVENEDVLNEWENDFVSDLVDKLDDYGTDIRISPKQQEILDRIEGKLDK